MSIILFHFGQRFDLLLQNGLLNHEDLEMVWEAYPKELHPWLLRLTEEFDLTFCLPDKAANIIPCLLPDAEPKVVLLFC